MDHNTPRMEKSAEAALAKSYQQISSILHECSGGAIVSNPKDCRELGAALSNLPNLQIAGFDDKAARRKA